MMRFGVSNWSAESGMAWRDDARRFEELGYDTLWVPDHVGMFDPFAALVAAAAATERVRVGTYVLNTEFWNPLLLARVAVTTHILSEGRLVLGLGAGHAKVEFDQAGLAYPAAGRRIDRLVASVPALRRLLAGDTVDDSFLGLTEAATGLAPTTPPILVGGNGDRVLKLAGEQADLVGLTGFTSGTGRVHTDLSHWSWDGLAQRLAYVRAAAQDHDRQVQVDILVQRAAVTDDPAAALADFTAMGMDEEQFDSPFLLVGSESDILSHVHRLQEMGIDALTVFARDADALAPVITHLRR
jgi:probable F420-dependent oxidoreductase